MINYETICWRVWDEVEACWAGRGKFKLTLVIMPPQAEQSLMSGKLPKKANCEDDKPLIRISVNWSVEANFFVSDLFANVMIIDFEMVHANLINCIRSDCNKSKRSRLYTTPWSWVAFQVSKDSFRSSPVGSCRRVHDLTNLINGERNVRQRASISKAIDTIKKICDGGVATMCVHEFTSKLKKRYVDREA